MAWYRSDCAGLPRDCRSRTTMSTTLTTPSTSRPPAEPERSAATALIVAAVVVVAMVALLALLIWGIGRQAAGSVGNVAVATRPAPSFSVQLFSGGAVGGAPPPGEAGPGELLGARGLP